MKELSKKETQKIYAGGGVGSTLYNVFLKGFNLFTDLGRYFGSSVRRMFSNNMCDF